jgi:hypothetical protein
MRPDQIQRKTVIEAGGLAVANLHVEKDTELVAWAMNEGLFFYVGRAVPRLGLTASPFASKFKVKPYGPFEPPESLELYRCWLSLHPDLMKQIPALAPRLLVCWCYPAPCHAEVIIHEWQGSDSRTRVD